MEFAKDIRRSKEIMMLKNRTTKNTPHGNKFPAARKQLAFGQSFGYNDVGQSSGRAGGHSTNFYGQQNSRSVVTLHMYKEHYPN